MAKRTSSRRVNHRSERVEGTASDNDGVSGSLEVLVHPAVELFLRELEMVPGGSEEVNLAGLVRSLEAEGVFLEVVGLIHGPELLPGASLKVAPPLALVGIDHGVLLCLDHDELLHLAEVLLEG